MIYQIQSDKRRFLSANRNARQRLPAAVARGAKADSSGIEINPDKTWVPKVPFADDFILEHTLGGRHLMSMEISGIF